MKSPNNLFNLLNDIYFTFLHIHQGLFGTRIIIIIIIFIFDGVHNASVHLRYCVHFETRVTDFISFTGYFQGKEAREFDSRFPCLQGGLHHSGGSRLRKLVFNKLV